MNDKDIDFLYKVYVEKEADPDYEKVFIEKIKLVYKQKEISKNANDEFVKINEELRKLNEEK